MFCLKCKLKVNYVRIIQPHHDVPLICDYAFLTTLQQSLFLHQFKGIESTSTFKSSKKYTTKSSSSDTLDNLEIFQLNIVMKLFSPNRFDLQQLSLEYFNGFASLEIVVFQYIPSSTCPPITYARRTEVVVVWVKTWVRNIYR